MDKKEALKNFVETGEKCPECGEGIVYKKEIGTQGRVHVDHFTCSRHTEIEDTDGDCSYYEEQSSCPDCGGKLEGETRGPDKIMGARSGRVSCTECDFSFHWSE